jgi:hypothetical protein
MDVSFDRREMFDTLPFQDVDYRKRRLGTHPQHRRALLRKITEAVPIAARNCYR